MAMESRNAIKTNDTQNFFSTIHFLPRSVMITSACRKKKATKRITPTIDESLFYSSTQIRKECCANSMMNDK